MLPTFKFLKRKSRFSKDEEGSVTVEAVLWLPVFVGFFALIADASLVFHSQAQMYRLLQDANRAYSIGRITSEEDTEDAILTEARRWSDNVVVDTRRGDDGVITSVMVIPAQDLDAVGFFGVLGRLNLTISAQHWDEA